MEKHQFTIEDYFNGLTNGGGHGTTLSPCPRFWGLDGKELENEVEQQLRLVSEKGIEITVTFKPELQDAFSSRRLTYMVYELLVKTKGKIQAVIIGEYSKTGLYHMHGSILADGKIINRVKRKLSKEIGRVEIKAIKYSESWVEYCLKKDDEVRAIHKPIVKKELIVI